MGSTPDSKTSLKFWKGKGKRIFLRLKRRRSGGVSVGKQKDKDVTLERTTTWTEKRGSTLARVFSLRLGQSQLSSEQDLAKPESHPQDDLVAPIIRMLPIEIHLHVLSFLNYPDLLALRRTSRFLSELMHENQTQVIRTIVRTGDERAVVVSRRFPSMIPATMDWHGLSELQYNYRVSVDLARHLADFIQTEILKRTSERSRERFARQYRNTQTQLVPPVLLLVHHFRRFRVQYVESLRRLRCAGNRHISRRRALVESLRLEERLLKDYPPELLLQAQHLYMFLMPAFYRYMRPPSYAGRIERSLRGWTMDAPSEEHYAILATIGGLEQMERLWRVKPYSRRRKDFDRWIESVKRPQHLDGESDPRHDDKASLSIGSNDKSSEISPLTSTAGPSPAFASSLEENEMLLANLPNFKSRFTPASVHVLTTKKKISSFDDIMRVGEVVYGLLEHQFAHDDDPLEPEGDAMERRRRADESEEEDL
ncbi:MAG: hypothetical protein M1825_003499 [Sarcosagium campestre]|nr:MAG: hypothetical protein M1825_003499 [Sarcosagium campestre]